MLSSTGDTGLASPFVGLALATMARYLNADTRVPVGIARRPKGEAAS
jgi:hypothetical protein